MDAQSPNRLASATALRVICDNDPKLPWHAALALVEIVCIATIAMRWRATKKLSWPPAVVLVLAAAAHVAYGVWLADAHPYVGPYVLPWHGIFIAAEVAALGFAARQYWKNKTVTGNDLSWLAIAAAVHVFYTVKLAERNPTFELEVRWYGVFFAIGLLGAARAIPLYFERWGFPRKHGEALCVWTAIGMLLGAHFVHLVFYETESLWENPIRILQLGSGLASHGGGLGAILAVILFARKQKLSGEMTMRYMDPAMCGATWVIPWVRVGNFFNSEIVGRQWDGPWAVTFPRHDCGHLLDHQGPTYDLCVDFLARRGQELLPRHPSQLYEAFLAFVMLGLAIYLQRKWRNRLRPGAILFILLGYYFTTRFGIEYVKELQAPTDTVWLTMGQKLSLPIVLLSVYMLFFSKISNIRSTVSYTPPPLAPDGGPLPEAEEVEGSAPSPARKVAGEAKAAARKKKKKKKP